MWRFTILFQSQSLQPIVEWTFLSICFSFLRGILFLMECESLWPPATSFLDAKNAGYLDIFAEDCQDGSGIKNILSQVDYKREHQVWCGWGFAAKCRRQGWLPLLYFYICSSPIQVCIVNMCSFVRFILSTWNYSVQKMVTKMKYIEACCSISDYEAA